MTIKAKDPVRKAFAACSTNGSSVGYYETKGHGGSAFEAALHAYGYSFDEDDCYGWNGDDGRKNCDIRDVDGKVAGCAVISWYRMPSGRYEFTGYIG